MEAGYYHTEGDRLRCTLCPHNCLIRDGKTGTCRVRHNINGTLIAGSYGRLSAIHLDPVEKKPLYHFFPGKNVLSIGSVGCNMHCRCCQNWDISQISDSEFDSRTYAPGEIAGMARMQRNNIGMAYTYNEPVVWIEFMLHTAHLVKEAGLKNVMVSNGYLTEAPLNDLLEYIDAFNIDLKTFMPEIHKRHTGGELQPVLDTLERIRRAGKHLEVTCPVVPGVSNDEEAFLGMVRWIRSSLGRDTPLHLSRYHPMFKMKETSTSPDLLFHFYRLASEYLSYVYVGNVITYELQDTRCGQCGLRVVVRRGYEVDSELSLHGTCRSCGTHIATME